MPDWSARFLGPSGSLTSRREPGPLPLRGVIVRPVELCLQDQNGGRRQRDTSGKWTMTGHAEMGDQSPDLCTAVHLPFTHAQADRIRRFSGTSDMSHLRPTDPAPRSPKGSTGSVVPLHPDNGSRMWITCGNEPEARSPPPRYDDTTPQHRPAQGLTGAKCNSHAT